MTREVPIEYKVNRAANSPDTQRHQLNRILEDIREKLESAGLSGDYVTQQELEAALAGLDLGGEVDVVVGGVAISVNSSNPAAPVVSVDISGLVSTDVGNTLTVGTDGGLFTSGGGGGQVDEVIAGDHVSVDDTDPTKPIVSVPISGSPSAGDPVVSDGMGGLEWGTGGGGGGGNSDIRIPFSGISDGDTRSVYVPKACSIRGVVGLFGQADGDIDVDVLVGDYSGFPPATVEHSFSLSSERKYKSSPLAIAVPVDGVIAVAFDNISTITDGELYLTIGAALGTEHEYWRIYITASSHVVAAIAEMEYRATPGGANLATGGTASASSEFSGTFLAGNAFDGNIATAWASTTAGFPPAWLEYHFATQVEVNQVAIRARNDAGVQAPVDFVIQSSDDGVAWTNEWSVTGSVGWSNGEQRIFTRP